MRIAGIDPGKTGALCLLSEAGMWLTKMPGDPHSVVDWLRQADPQFAVVEKVHAGGTANAEGRKMGATSAFTFGQGYGVLLGTLAALQIRHELITPQRWIKGVGAGKDKDAHLAQAKRLWPNETIYKYACDAVLIAEYGRRYLIVEAGGGHNG